MRLSGQFAGLFFAVLSIAVAPAVRCQTGAASATPVESPIYHPISRFAVVIGIENYTNHPHVTNALNDAEIIAARLVDAQFNVIRPEPDPVTGSNIGEPRNWDEMMKPIEKMMQLVRDSKEPATVIVYFAGHGFQYIDSTGDTKNFLAPRDAPKPTGNDKDALANASVSMTDLVNALETERRPGLTIFMIDACRENILEGEPVKPSPLQRTPNRELPRSGFAYIERLREAIVSYSTGYNDVAKSVSNFNGQNSPYANALNKYLLESSLTLVDMLGRVSDLVSADTGWMKREDEWRQKPSDHNLARGRNFFFHSKVDDSSKEQTLLDQVEKSGNPDCVDYYFGEYRDGRYARRGMELERKFANVARTRLCNLR